MISKRLATAPAVGIILNLIFMKVQDLSCAKKKKKSFKKILKHSVKI